MKRLTCAPLLLITWYVLGVLSIVSSQETAEPVTPEGEIRVQPLAPMTRAEWEQSFSDRFTEKSGATRSSEDPVLVALVTDYSWLAVSQARAWILRLDPKRGTDGTPRRSLLMARCRTIGQILAHSVSAPALLEVLSRIERWSSTDWNRFRSAVEMADSAGVLHDERRWNEALASFRKAERMLEALGRVDRLPRILKRLGNCQYRLGRYRAALSTRKKTLATNRSLGDLGAIAGAHLDLGASYASLHDFAKETEHFHTALAMYRRAGIKSGIARSLAALGEGYLVSGRPGQAIGCYKKALAIARDVDDNRIVMNSLLGIGGVHEHMMRYEQALKFYDDALKLARKDPDRSYFAFINTRLGTVYSDMNRYQEAIRCFRSALDIQIGIGNRHHIVASLNGLGNAYYYLDRNETSLSYFMRAYEHAKQSGIEWIQAAPLHGMANIYFEQGKTDEALDCYQRSFAIFSRIGDTAQAAQALKSIGQTYSELGDFEQAYNYYRRSLRCYTEAKSPSGAAELHDDLGSVCSILGKHESAVEHHLHALSFWEKTGATDKISQSLYDAANAYSSLNRYEDALVLHRRALQIRRENGKPFYIGASLAGLGSAYNSIGFHDEAVTRFQEARKVFEKTGDRINVAATLIALGNVHYARDRYSDALEYYRQCLDISNENRYLKHVAASRTGMGNVFFFQNRFDAAYECYKIALAYRKNSDSSEAAAHALCRLGIVSHELHRHQEAARYYKDAIQILEHTDNHDLLGKARLYHCMTLSALGQHGEARKELADALSNLTRSRIRMSTDRERIEHGKVLQGILAEVLRAALQHVPKLGPDPDLAVRAFESIRGVATAALFESSFRNVHPARTDRNVAELNEIEDRIDALEIRMAKMRRAAGTTGSRNPRSESEQAGLREQQKKLARKWRDRYSEIERLAPAYAHLRCPRPVRLDELKSILPKDTAYLSVVLGKEASILFLIDREALRHWRLVDGKTIIKATKRYLEILKRTPGGDDAKRILGAGMELYSLLLGPADEILSKYRTLIFSPEHVLNGLPLGTLVRPGDNEDLRSASFVVRSHAVLYAHSFTVWDIQRRRILLRERSYASGTSSRPARILIIGDPVCPGETEAEGAGDRRDFVMALKRDMAMSGRLLHTRYEAFEVFSKYGGAPVLRKEMPAGGWKFEIDGRGVKAEDFVATMKQARCADGDMRNVRIRGPSADLLLGACGNKKAVLSAGLGRYRYIHIASHAHVDTHNPGLSGVVLSPSVQDSGYLRLIDVMNLDLRSELVTLSGCETASGEFSRGEGFQGLVRAFLFAGAENVVAAAWRVPDDTTASLLPDVYRTLERGGCGPARTLQEAKLRFLDRIPPSASEQAHPHFWGAWMLWGIGIRSAK